MHRHIFVTLHSLKFQPPHIDNNDKKAYNNDKLNGSTILYYGD